MDKPAISLEYDPVKQAVGVKLDPEQVKNWTFAMAILDMAKEAAKDMLRHQQVTQMQRAMADHEVTQRFAKKIVMH